MFRYLYFHKLRKTLYLYKVLLVFVLLISLNYKVLAKEDLDLIVPEPTLLVLGKEVYFAKSSDGCHRCHGDITSGNTEGIRKEKNSADLNDPQTWVAYLALGGNETYSQNPEAFTKSFENIILDLIKVGAHQWNREYFGKASGETGFDWARVSGKDSYDSQMKGINYTGAKKVLKKIDRIIRKEGIRIKREELSDLAAFAVLTFLQKHSVNKNN